MNNNLKIALFTDNFFPALGGTENAVYNLANQLVGLGHEVLVVAPNYKNADDSNYKFGVVRKCSIKIDANNNYALPIFNKKLFARLDDFKPDIVHCHTQASMLKLAIKYSQKHNIPCVSTMHTKFSYCYKDSAKLNIIVKPMLKSIGKKLKKVDVVTTVSQSMKDEFLLYGYKGDFKVIKNGISISKFDDADIENLAKEKYNINKEDNVFIFVGRMTKVKNLDFIINCLDELNKKNINFKMFFVGDGDYLNNLKKQTIKKNLTNKVIFTGKITDKKMLASLYYNSSLNIFPSIFDNDSLTIIEAALYCTPSITLENTGSAERIVDGKNGFVVKNDVSSMANKIEYLLQHKEEIKTVAVKASETMAKSWSDVAKEYLQIYYDLLKKNA